ncbi:MAG: AAA family ATPase [Acidimicrobiales bacterium]|nr:AAA family ATPase [Acidimicrobiales bacterium]
MTNPSDATVGEGPLRVRVLGGFALEGIDERALGTRKARLLLKRLAVAAGRPVAADELAEVLWPDRPPKQPADQVSVLVSRLRAVLGSGRLPRSDAGYCLAADWFDLVELERRVADLEERTGLGERASALAAAHAALALAVGGLIPEEDGDWLDEARPGVDRLVARARLLAGEAAFAAGEFGAARAAAQSVLDGDPYDEAALRLVMRADAAAGRPGAALAAYATVRHRLSEDLGADPAPETEQLHTAIVRGEFTTASDADDRTPELVGREGEIELLDALLARAAGAAAAGAVIEAEAGMGKSALLSAWMSRATRQALVISSRCDELGGDLPLQPIVDGLAAYLDGLGRQATGELLGGEAAILDPLLGRATPRAVGATTVTDMEAGRAVLFAALSAVLRRAAGERPLVVIVDDLHQAAPGTAEFLAFCLRRMSSTMVVAARRPEPGPDLPAARRLVLGPLSLADTDRLVGAERAPALHERSGGHPLFLRELATASDDELPGSLIASVTARLEGLGGGAASIQVAALCGSEVDAALVADVSGRPVPVVLDDLEWAARTGLLHPRGAALAFSHELVREAIEAGASPPRRAEVHRAAVAALARRPETDPLALARHARLGGDPAVAAQALVAAAQAAAERFEAATAEQLLDQAIELYDSPAARRARGQLRLARLDLDAARRDALRAIDLGAGVEGFELAGWVAYYGRDYDAALGYADEGVERAGDPGIRASCLALAGRIRHTRGQLAEAAARLEEGVAVAPAPIRGMVQVWYAQLLAHRGEPDRAAEVARRGVLDPHLAHPFAGGHGRFTLAYAHGVVGRWGAALEAVDELDALVARQGDRRFPPVAANMRGWLLRGAGLLNEACELHELAVASDPGPTFQEARYAGLLDLAECHLAFARLDQAAAAVDSARGVIDWTGSMSWRHRNRYRLLADRVAALAGHHRDAAADARAVAAGAEERGDLRYHYRGLVVAATIDARSGETVDLETLGQLVERFVPLCGPDGWRDLAELAAATGCFEIWQQAENQASIILAAAAARPDVDGHRVADAVRRQLDRLKP